MIGEGVVILRILAARVVRPPVLIGACLTRHELVCEQLLAS